jgi:hypothetical protein
LSWAVTIEDMLGYGRGKHTIIEALYATEVIPTY